MSKVEISGIKIDSSKDIESITINVNYSANSVESTEEVSNKSSKVKSGDNLPFQTTY